MVKFEGLGEDCRGLFYGITSFAWSDWGIPEEPPLLPSSSCLQKCQDIRR